MASFGELEGLGRRGGGHGREARRRQSLGSEASGQVSSVAQGSGRPSWPAASSQARGGQDWRRGPEWFVQRRPVEPEQRPWAGDERRPSAAQLSQQLKLLADVRGSLVQASMRSQRSRQLFVRELEVVVERRGAELEKELAELERVYGSLASAAPEPWEGGEEEVGTAPVEELGQRLWGLAERLGRLERGWEELAGPVELTVGTLRPLDSAYAHLDQALYAYAQPLLPRFPQPAQPQPFASPPRSVPSGLHRPQHRPNDHA